MIPDSHYFSIADHFVCLKFAENQRNGMFLLPAFEPFREQTVSGKITLDVEIDDTLRPIPKDERTRIRTFPGGNGDIVVDKLNDGGYQFILKDLQTNECALLISNADFSKCKIALKGNYDMRCFGLNSALMIAYANATCFYQTVLIHASLVRHNGVGYAFNAKSGTGKSTQVSMWLRYIPNCDLMNDDNPILRIIEGKVIVYGGPWSGKTPCYRQIKAPLGAITRISQASENRVERLEPIEAIASLIPSCSAMKWDSNLYDKTLDTLKQFVEKVGIYVLHCLPNKDSAVICHQTIAI